MEPPQFRPGTRVLLNLLSAAFVLRLLGVAHHSFDVAEGAAWRTATSGGVLEAAFARPGVPPAWPLFERFVAATWGVNETLLRLPSVLCGVVSVWVAYLVARRLFHPVRLPSAGEDRERDDTLPLWVAGGTALSALGLASAQDAGPYAALSLASLTLAWLYLLRLDGGGRGTVIAYAVVAVVAEYVHPLAAWVVASHLLHAIVVARRSVADGAASRAPLAPFALAAGVALAAFVPWLAWDLPRRAGVPAAVSFAPVASGAWRAAVGPAVAAFDRPWMEAGSLAWLRANAVVVALTALAWFAPIALGVRALRRERGLASLLACLVLVPVAGAVATSPFAPTRDARDLLFLAPWLLVVALMGVRSVPPLARAALLLGLGVVHVAGALAYHAGDPPEVVDTLSAGHPYGTQDWRSAEDWIRKDAGEGARVWLEQAAARDVWDFYDRGRLPTTVLPDGATPRERVAGAGEDAASASTVYVVLSHGDVGAWNAYGIEAVGHLALAWGGVETDRVEFTRGAGLRVVRLRRPKP